MVDNQIKNISPFLDRDYFYNDFLAIEKSIDNSTVRISSHNGSAIKREILKNIFFTGDPKGADTRFMSRVLARSNSLVCLKEPLFYVDIRSNSVSHRDRNNSFYLDWVIDEINNIYRTKKDVQQKVSNAKNFNYYV